MKNLLGWFKGHPGTRPARRTSSRRSRPVLESLETRVVLYSNTGNAWMNPEVITISFVPDGTNLGGVTSNLQGTFNGNANLDGRWENVILQAAQLWAQQTNINFEVVSDDGAASGGGADQEGDPDFGDIRIGGYNFGNSTLAYTCYPPSVNNFSVAGDIDFNTGMPFNIGSTYDLFTVAAHEFGHALGLGESSTSGLDVMYPTYDGAKTALASDDIAGIRNIYSSNLPRSTDTYLGSNSTISAASNLDSTINMSTFTALEYNLDIATAGQKEFFSVDVPSGTSGLFEVTAQSLGLSLLDPGLTVYASNMTTVLGAATGTGYSGSAPTVPLTGVTAGERLYIEVQGANTTQIGTGDYALGMSFNAAAVPPTEPSPVIAYPNGTPLHGGGGSPNQVNSTDDVAYDAAPTVTCISPDTGSSDSDGITDVNRIVIKGIAANNETVNVYIDGVLVGQTTANAEGNWSFDNTGTALADGTYILTATSIDCEGAVSPSSYPYGITIDTTPPSAPIIAGVVDGTLLGSTGGTVTDSTTDSTPVLYGTAQPYSYVAIYQGSTQVGTVGADSSGDWDWSVNDALSLGVSYSFTAQATDVAGNVSILSAARVVIPVQPPTSAPAASVSAAFLSIGSILGINVDGSFNTTATPTITGLATPNSEVAVLDDGVIIGVALVNSMGSWSFSAPTLSAGRQVLTFEAVNQLGNISSPSHPITIMV